MFLQNGCEWQGFCFLVYTEASALKFETNSLLNHKWSCFLFGLCRPSFFQKLYFCKILNEEEAHRTGHISDFPCFHFLAERETSNQERTTSMHTIISDHHFFQIYIHSNSRLTADSNTKHNGNKTEYTSKESSDKLIHLAVCFSFHLWVPQFRICFASK